MPTYIITGANRGLGLEFVKQLSAESSNVVIASSRSLAPERLGSLSSLRSNSKNVHILECDTSSAESIEALGSQVKGIVGLQGKVDYVINNAGINSVPHEDSLSLTPKGLHEQVTVNILGPAKMVQVLLPLLHRGSVVMNMTSGLGSLAHSRSKSGTSATAYSISKAGLNMLTVHQSIDLKDKGVIVIAMDPGWVRTDMGGKGALLEQEESIGGMLRCLAGLRETDSGKFYAYDGKEKAW